MVNTQKLPLFAGVRDAIETGIRLFVYLRAEGEALLCTACFPVEKSSGEALKSNYFS